MYTSTNHVPQEIAVSMLRSRSAGPQCKWHPTWADAPTADPSKAAALALDVLLRTGYGAAGGSASVASPTKWRYRATALFIRDLSCPFARLLCGNILVM